MTLTLALFAACGGSPPPPPSKPEAHPERPTREQCVAAVDHLGRVLPELFPSREHDLADCLGLPRSVVDCLVTVTDEESLDRCVRGWCAKHPRTCPRAGGFAPRPLAADCDRALDHLLSLRGAGRPTERDRASFVEDCRARASTAAVDCVLHAQDLNALERCANDSPRAPR